MHSIIQKQGSKWLAFAGEDQEQLGESTATDSGATAPQQEALLVTKDVTAARHAAHRPLYDCRHVTLMFLYKLCCYML